jgi:DNA polymerase-3 subunit delta'
VASGARRVSLHPLFGHADLQASLSRAWAAGTIPSSVLIHGPRGVGKQRLALWLGQLLLCSESGVAGPCGDCKACRTALNLEHPDLHWYFPLAKPRGVRPNKLADAMEEARYDVLAERRSSPLRPAPVASEPTGLYLAVAQTLRSHAHRRPAVGPRQVFVVGDSETLVPQESSQEAANALLKVLEEPPSSTFLILTSSEPGLLLPTIRSRTMPLHLPPLAADQVERFLVDVGGVPQPAAHRAARLGRGSIGRALGFLPIGEDPGPLEVLRGQAFDLLSAASDTDGGSVYRKSLELGGTRSRGLMPLFELLEDALRDLSAIAAGMTDSLINTDQEDFLERILDRRDIHPVTVTRAFRHLEEAKELMAGNVNPQLIVAGLLTGIREELIGNP